MENSSTQEDLSSTANHSSFSGAGDGGNASESDWTSYIDYFIETQRRQQQQLEEASSAAPSADDVVERRHSTSQYCDDRGVGGSSRLPALLDPSEASRRLSLSLEKEGWRKKVMYDESLEDTATSPISRPNKKTTAVDDLAGYNHLSTNNGANTTTTDVIDGHCGHDNNELKKNGLCLVPVSGFHV